MLIVLSMYLWYQITDVDKNQFRLILEQKSADYMYPLETPSPDLSDGTSHGEPEGDPPAGEGEGRALWRHYSNCSVLFGMSITMYFEISNL